MAVKQKLRSRRGATLMAALLFFLVAAVCGSIILAAATATLSRMTTQAEDARAYYSLTSAAQLMREDLLQSHWQVTVTQTKIGETISHTYSIKALDAYGNVDDKTFVPDLLRNLSSDSLALSVTITTQKNDDATALPLVYARPDPISFDTLYTNYNAGKNTQLKLLMTNDPEGLPTSGGRKIRNTFTENSKTRQVYWLELTLDSVKVPSGYADKTTDDAGDIVFEIGWENATIRKLETGG